VPRRTCKCFVRLHYGRIALENLKASFEAAHLGNIEIIQHLGLAALELCDLTPWG
jgi:hypothetical protein